MTGREILVNEFLEFFLFERGQGVDFAVGGFASWLEINGMVPWSFWGEFIEHLFFKDLLVLMIMKGNDLCPRFFNFLYFLLNGDVGGNVRSCTNVSWFQDSAFGGASIEFDRGSFPINGRIVVPQPIIS